MGVIAVEKPIGVVVAFGGQTAIKLTSFLDKQGIRILGTSAEGIDLAEDRERFDALLGRRVIKRPRGMGTHSLDEALSGISLPGYRIVRGPETGLVMARGRVGNVGDVFNVGEVLVTRCVVQLEEKTLGHAWIMGESPRHAELAALCDALWQQESYAALLDEKLRPCLEQAIDEKRKAAARDAAGTKVNFFTFVRGEDQ